MVFFNSTRKQVNVYSSTILLAVIIVELTLFISYRNKDVYKLNTLSLKKKIEKNTAIWDEIKRRFLQGIDLNTFSRILASQQVTPPNKTSVTQYFHRAHCSLQRLMSATLV